MKPTAAEAMQWRALGSMLLERKPALNSFERGIALPDRPLAGAEHADAARPALLQRGLEFLRHDVEGFVPGHRRELAVLVVLAVRLAQHRLRQAIMAVHDLGEEIALDAVEAAIDLGLDVAVGGDDAVVLGRDHHAAAGAAEPAGRLVPFQFAGVALGDEIGGERRHRHSGRGGRDGGGLELQHLAAVELGVGHERSPGAGHQPASMA